MSRPDKSPSDASELSTSRRLSSLTRSIIGWRNVSRSPGRSKSTIPSMSSCSSAAIIDAPTASGDSAPPVLPPRSCTMAKTPAAPSAITPTASPAIPRRLLRPCGSGSSKVSSPPGARGGVGGATGAPFAAEIGGGITPPGAGFSPVTSSGSPMPSHPNPCGRRVMEIYHAMHGDAASVSRP